MHPCGRRMAEGCPPAHVPPTSEPAWRRRLAGLHGAGGAIGNPPVMRETNDDSPVTTNISGNHKN